MWLSYIWSRDINVRHGLGTCNLYFHVVGVLGILCLWGCYYGIIFWWCICTRVLGNWIASSCKRVDNLFHHSVQECHPGTCTCHKFFILTPCLLLRNGFLSFGGFGLLHLGRESFSLSDFSPDIMRYPGQVFVQQIWKVEAYDTWIESLVMPNGDLEERIFLFYPHTNNGFFFLLTTIFYSKISFQKSLNTLTCNITWWHYFNITMTSVDDHVREFQYKQCM